MPPKKPSLSKLKLLRLKRGLSLGDVARDCDCEKSQISRWERLINEPAHDYRQLYAECLGLSVGQLGSLMFDERRRLETANG